MKGDSVVLDVWVQAEDFPSMAIDWSILMVLEEEGLERLHDLFIQVLVLLHACHQSFAWLVNV